MAEDLYEQYAGLFDQQVGLVEQAVVGIVRAALGDFSSDFKQHLRSLVPPRRGPPATSGDPPSSQQLTRAEEIESARDSAQRQIATALANGFGAFADLPSALGIPASQPSIPGPSTQATVDANEANNNADNSDDDSMSFKSEGTSECESDCESHSDDENGIKEEVIEEEANEMAATAGTLNVNTSDTVSVKTEIESECDSSDSESSDEEEDLTAGRGIKEEIDDANPNAQNMGNSIDENGGMEMMEEGQEENETQSNDNTNDSNFEIVHSQVDNSNETNCEQPSDAMMIDDVEASNEEGDDGPTIIVVNYEESEIPSIGSPSDQSTIAEGSWNEESANIAEPDGEFVETADSNGQLGTLQTGTRKRKRPNGRTRKSIVPKRIRVVPVPTVAAELQHQVDDESESEEEDNPESEAISFRVIVRRLNCRVPGCKKVFQSKVQLDGHLLTKHGIEKYACKVKDCTESYATMGELTTHRNSAHDDLDNEWPCGECETICNSYKRLVSHICYYHEYGQYACSADKCNFTEKSRIKVNTHQRKHRPAKYRCTYAGCSSSFNKKSHLTTHLRVHSKEKPFLCSLCPKAFAQKIHLTDHERVHSGLKPYSCTWLHCDFSASKRSNVIGHIRGVHFGLPRSKKKQIELRIIDNRDPRLFVKKTTTNDN